MASSTVPESLFTHTASKFRQPLDLPAPRAAYSPSPHPEEQRGPYLLHEWIEEHGWYARVLDHYNKVYQECHTICPVTEAHLVSEKARYKPSTEEEVERYEKTLPVHDEDWQIDENGVLLMAMIKDAALLPWSGDKAKELLEIPMAATTALATFYPPPMPEDDDSRHINHAEERANCKARGWEHGIWHLGTRRQQGHQQQQPTISKDTHPDTEKGAAVNSWYQQMAPYHQTLGMPYYGLDKAGYAHNKQIVDHWADRSFSAGIKRTDRACFTYHPVLVNARVAPHLDRNDSLSSMVAMFCTGDFREGGNVLIPLFGRQYALRPGGVMFLRASLIEHWISAYEGQRYSFVHAIPENLNNLRDAYPAPLRILGKRRTAEDAAEEESASIECEECPFCSKAFVNLKSHLSGWRKRIPKPAINGHSAEAVREWCDAQGWEPYYATRSRVKRARKKED